MDGKEAGLLVLLDLTMPEMDGRSCFFSMKEAGFDIDVIVVTGHGADGVSEELLERGVADIIAKPFDILQISKIVARVIRS